MAVRLTGLISNMDTDTIIKGLMEAQSGKKVKIEQNKKKLEWKNDKWKELNTKLYALYNEKLSKMKLQGYYKNKTATASDETKVTATASSEAAKGSYSLKINKLASSQYVTGLDMSEYEWKTSTKLTELRSSINGTTGLEEFSGMELGMEITLRTGEAYDEVSVFTVEEDSTIASFVSFLNSAGLNASYDAGQGRFFIGSESSGVANRFVIESDTASTEEIAARESIKNLLDFENIDAEDQESIDYALYEIRNSDPATEAETIELAEQLILSMAEKYEKQAFEGELNVAIASLKSAPEGGDVPEGSGLDALGLMNITEEMAVNGHTGAGVIVTAASDSEYVLNGATLTGDSNTVTVNGLTMNLKGMTAEGETLSLTVGDDTEKTVEGIKEFIKSYNELIVEMSELFYAKSAKGYNMLTEEEEDSMTDSQVELWNDKIKDSLLRRDDTLNSIMTGMRSALQTSIEIEGVKYSLSSFGIVTGDYAERGILHINGDKEDGVYGDRKDLLTAAINDDPELVGKALAGIFGKLSDTMFDQMKKTELSSALTFYNDTQIQKQIDEYDDQIKLWSTRLVDMEDKYYKQFSAMEVAMQKLQAQQNSLAGFLG